MTNDDIEREVTLFRLRTPYNMPPRELEGFARAIASQAYEEAALAMCFSCRHGFSAWQEDGTWLHGVNDRCHAYPIRNLKAALEPVPA